MIRKSRFVLVLSLAAAAALAGNLSIVSSFPSQINWRRGLDYGGGGPWYLYQASNDPSNKIMVYDTAGSLVRTVPTVPGTFGIEVFVSSGYISVNTYPSGYVYRLTSEGSVVSSFHGPASGSGLTYGRGYYYFASATAGKIYVLTNSGSVVRSFPQPGAWVGGLDFENDLPEGRLWISDSVGIFYCDTMGSILDSFVPAPGAAYPTGVCWDGAYVWYHDYNSPGYVYKAQVTFSSIAPASLGRVKALFR